MNKQNTDEKLDEVIKTIDQLMEKRDPYPHNKEYVQSLLPSSKPKKLLNNKRKFVKKTTLTRKEYARLGLNNIPTKSLKYTDVLPLNQLWEEYIIKHMGMDKSNFKIPEIKDFAYTNFCLLLGRADFTGANITVIRSRCPSLVHKQGIVIKDSKQTFTIVEKDDRSRTIPKCFSQFRIQIQNLEIMFLGQFFNIRPAERSVKKIKNCMVPDL